MTCKEVLDSISLYIDADLKEDIVGEMKRHIGMCSDCRAEFDSLTMTLKLYRHDETPQLPAGCHDRLVKVLQFERSREKQADVDPDPTKV